MAGIAQPFISELEQEAATTRRVLERVPGDQFGFQPHPRSMALGKLALHVAGIPGAFARMGRMDGLDVATAQFSPPDPESVDQILQTLDTGVADAHSFLSELTDETANAPWRAHHGERELFTVPRLGLVRRLMLNHWYHHRGQLLIYLRMLDVPVPSVYGPSADENPFAQA